MRDPGRTGEGMSGRGGDDNKTPAEEGEEAGQEDQELQSPPSPKPSVPAQRGTVPELQGREPCRRDARRREEGQEAPNGEEVEGRNMAEGRGAVPEQGGGGDVGRPPGGAVLDPPNSYCQRGRATADGGQLFLPRNQSANSPRGLPEPPRGDPQEEKPEPSTNTRLLTNRGPDRSGSCLILIMQQPD